MSFFIYSKKKNKCTFSKQICQSFINYSVLQCFYHWMSWGATLEMSLHKYIFESTFQYIQLGFQMSRVCPWLLLQHHTNCCFIFCNIEKPKKDYAKKHIIWEQKIGASWFFSQLLRVRVMREWVWRARTLLLSRMYIHKTLNTLCYIKIIIYRVPICIQRTGDWAIDISRPTNMPRLLRVGSDVPK